MSHPVDDADAGTVATVVRHDILSSLVVFLVALPLCMGIAIASGVPVAAGLITGIVGGIVVGALAGSPLQVSGPAAGLTVIVYGIAQKDGLVLLAAAVTLAGIVQIVAGLLKLGQWFRAVMPAVVQGMLSGIGILIFASQFHVMFDESPKGSGWQNIIAMPTTLAEGLRLPPLGDDQRLVVHKEVLQEARRLAELQSRSVKEWQQASSAAPEAKQQLRGELTERQSEIVRGLEALRETAEAGDPLDDNKVEGPNLAEAIGDALSTARTADQELRQPAVEPSSLMSAATSIGGVTSLLKRRDVAFHIGLVTIVSIIAWARLKKTRLGIIPPQLVAVTLSSTLAAILVLPVFYVDVPDRLLASIRLPTAASLAQLDLRALLTAVVTLAIVASAETLLCASAVDQMHNGPRTKYDRELMAQGVGNTIAGLLGGLPMTGVIVRSAANVHAGGKTRWSAVLHGVWLLGFVALGGSLLRLIPTAALAAILVLTGWKLMNFGVTRQLAKFGSGVVTVYWSTVAGVVLLDLLTGVILGIVLSATLILIRFSRLDAELEYRPDGRTADLYLRGAATFVRLPLLANRLERIPGDVTLHVHINELTDIDHACFDLLFNWRRQHEAQGGRLVLDWERLSASFRPTRTPVEV